MGPGDSGQIDYRYRLLVEHSYDSMAIFDIEGNYLYASPASRTLLQIEPEALVGRSVYEMVHPDDLEPLRQTHRRLLAGTEPETLRCRVRRLDGTFVWTETTARRIPGAGSHPDGEVIAVSRDISGQMLAEKALRESEHQYRTLVEQSCDPIYVMQSDPMRLVLVNPAWERLLGYAGAEATAPGFDFMQIVAPASRRLIEEREARRERGQPVLPIYEFSALTRDGRVLELEASVTEIMWGGHLAQQGMYRNISTYKEAEKRLRFSDQILKRVGAVVVAADSTGKIAYAGPAVKDILGFEPEELLGDGWWILTHSHGNLECQRERVAAMARGEVAVSKIPYEEEMEHRDGSKRWILWHDTLAPDGQLIGVGQDITERKRAEEQLQKVIHAVEQSPISVVISDTRGCIEYANAKFIQTTGYSPQEVIGRHVDILESGEMPRDEYNAIWDTVRDGREWRGELRSRRRDGGLFWEQASVSPIRNAQGETTHFVVVKEDITLRRSLEQQLRQAQKMEAVGRLAGGIAHDFNNMLTAINGYSELIMGSLGHTDPLRKDVEEIRKAGERAASLTRQLLAFSRKQVLMPRVLDLNTVLVDIDKLVRRLIGDDIKLTADLQPDLWRIKADPGQVEQVILNLVINARDAMPLGGELVTRTANEVIDAGIAGTRMGMKPGSFVHLSLSDTGCGMDPETLAHAFEPFFTTKEVGKGTGLGLSTAYGIIKQSGGYIYASSEVDYGTTVDIYLPAVETAAEGTADAGPEPATRRQEVILIVEDEEIVRSLYAKILRLRGYTVLEASNGREALSVAEGHPDPFQLLVTDIVMPEIGGRELALRLAPARPGMKVLYLSGYTDDTLALRRIQEAGAAFLLKPFSPDDLARKVHEILSQP